ncbi:glycosyltransferase family 2 protein [Streptococcus gallolyticus]|uniref:glycosyltransferase family 2 protein n=1 Tax=Streptococcus hepaticus TaxID=3349163 RepID=UPI001C943491|nr:glycosyltransferase family 2 protein [Streptococcus gallolyticus]MBY5041088.1 glycosyltransferase family 2 protein [Streptococcus gallolyticus]
MKVTILMSTYNGERFLAEQIRSIQDQTFTNWKLLIRDDGSNDRTPEIIQEFVEKDSRIHFMNTEDRTNLGVIKNFYTLLKYEKADVYFFSDQDDIWLPEKMAMTLAEAEHYPADQPLLIYTDLKVVNQELEVLSESMIRSQSYHANTSLIQELTENTVTGGTMMINHSLAELWTRPDNILMHDWYLALLATAFGKLVYIDQAGELYRQHDSNVLGARTLSKRMQHWIRPHLLFAKYWQLIKDSQLQASHLLQLPLTPDKRDLVQAYVTIMDKGLIERVRILKKYSFKKNKAFHTFVFTILILTKFAYKE